MVLKSKDLSLNLLLFVQNIYKIKLILTNISQFFRIGCII